MIPKPLTDAQYNTLVACTGPFPFHMVESYPPRKALVAHRFIAPIPGDPNWFRATEAGRAWLEEQQQSAKRRASK